MIFGKLQLESTIQENDKTRLNGLDSFITVDEAAITLMRIKPSATDSFIDVTSNKYLDWSYSSEATETVELEITTDGAPSVFTKTISVISSATDRLFSNDSDLVEIEDDILNYIRKGRNSFLDKHRQSQKRIMDSLDRRRLFKTDGTKLPKEEILGLEEIKQWSTYLTLQIIFESLRIEPNDVFTSKANHYAGLAGQTETSVVIRLDENADSEQDSVNINLQTGRLLRR